jgi:cyclopropane fatty-acyl-phospholipid synthase-like methyltransferase
MHRRRVLAALAAAALAGGCSTPGVKLDAPYVSTPEAVVAEMLWLAQVRAGDVVYDLGCGDGRIVIAAARDFGASGVGIDIDPARIAEANMLARLSGVGDRVRFAVQDLFQTDFSDASVVALYLYPELNAKLLPKFRAELRPGTRIVSHQFGIGDWPPQESVRVWVGSLDHMVHLWVVPPR